MMCFKSCGYYDVFDLLFFKVFNDIVVSMESISEIFGVVDC